MTTLLIVLATLFGVFWCVGMVWAHRFWRGIRWSWMRVAGIVFWPLTVIAALTGRVQ